ncbi:hypothetical protein BH11PSE13_BH11PSE13_12360 [soil metagenome]
MSDQPMQTLEQAEDEMWAHLRLAPHPEPGPPPPIDLKQIIYALKRIEAQQRAHADRLHEQLDYNAEFPYEDAERIKEAVTLLLAKPVVAAVSGGQIDAHADVKQSGRVVEVCCETNQAIFRFEGIAPEVGASVVTTAPAQPQGNSRS